MSYLGVVKLNAGAIFFDQDIFLWRSREMRKDASRGKDRTPRPANRKSTASTVEIYANKSQIATCIKQLVTTV